MNRFVFVRPIVPLALLGVLGACTPDDCDNIAQSGDFGALLVKGAKTLFTVSIGPVPIDLACGNMPPPDYSPAEQDQALAPSGACAPAVGDDACVACAKVSCCMPSLTCFAENECTCRIASKTLEYSAAESDKCGAEDAAYVAEMACMSVHCGEQCPRLQ